MFSVTPPPCPALLVLLSLYLAALTPRALSQHYPDYGQPFTAHFAPDSAGMWHLEFNTVKGMNYIIEESTDLLSWTPKAGGYFYGDGVPKREFIIQGSIPPEAGGTGGPTNPGPGKSLRIITFQVILSSNVYDQTVLVKRLASTSGSVSYSAWDTVLYNTPMPRPSGGQRTCIFMNYQDAQTVIWTDSVVRVESIPLLDTLPSAGQQETFELTVFKNTILPQITAQILSPALPTQPSPVASARRFLRVRRDEIDSNGSGIPDWYKWANSFNVFSPASFFDASDGDADGDGLSNRDEYLLGTSARSTDSDGDGALDSQEAAEGTDPLNNAVHPAVMRWIHQEVNYAEITPPPVASSINYSLENSWGAPDMVPQKNTAIVALSALKSTFNDPDLEAFPAVMPADAFKNTHMAALSNYAQSYVVIPSTPNLTPTSTGLGASGYRYRVWMEQKPAPAQAVTKAFMRRQNTVITRINSADGALDPNTVLSETAAAQPAVFSIPAGQTRSAFLDIDPGWVEMTRAALSQPKISFQQDVTVELKAVEIEPDQNMAGVIGDTVRSAMPGSNVRHFVTPKKSTQLPQDYVELRAKGIDAALFAQYFDWDGGIIGASAEKRKVKRDATGMTPLKIRFKSGGAVAAQMNVWVVWTDVNVNPTQARINAVPPAPGDPNNPGGNWANFFYLTGGGGRYVVENTAASSWKFVFSIQPVGIITAQERPALDGKRDKPVPGAGKPYVGIFPGSGDTAEFKWDTSRRMTIVIRNPQLIPKAQIQEAVGPTIAIGQPTSYRVAVSYPVDYVEGNDDPFPPSGGVNQKCNPYEISTTPGLTHSIGELSTYDAPVFNVLGDWGAPGRTFTQTVNFDEFARVQLWDGKRTGGRFWFRISDPVLWHHKVSAVWTGSPARWNNNGSSSKHGAVAP